MQIEWLCVLFAISLIIWLYSTSIWLLRPQWPFSFTLTILTFLGLWSYLACVFTPPGYNEVDQVDKLEFITYCDKCDWYRPERTHHCRSCGKCILRMDHHCPWIAGCVGYFNHGHFLRFLFYCWLAVTLNGAALIYRTWQSIQLDVDWEYFEGFLLIFNLALSFFLSLVLGLLFGTNFWSCCHNRTTIEEAEYSVAKTGYPFDVGVWGNLRQFLGSRMLPLPLNARLCGLGDGMTFPRISSDPWPPELSDLAELRNDEIIADNRKRYWDPKERAFVVPGGLIASQIK